MGAMQRGVLFAVILGSAGLGFSRSAPPATPQQANNKTDIERGHYLVEEVAKCGECHTPRNAQGELERDKWLQGASIWIMPVQPIHNWAERVPPLAGLPSYSDEQAETILEKGTAPDGDALQPPMHIYHLTHEDAKAIIAYLRSLPQSSR